MVDLMEAMSFVMNDKRRPINVRVINRFKTIEDDGRHMIYRLRRVSTISKEENHV
jgi:hypothetical protein